MSFAASPRTAVDPTCSIRRGASPREARIRDASCSKRDGHSELYATMTGGSMAFLFDGSVVMAPIVAHPQNGRVRVSACE